MYRSILKAAVLAAAGFAVSGALPASALAATFTLTGNSGTTGTAGNVRTFTSGGVTVRVTGYSIGTSWGFIDTFPYFGQVPSLQKAYVGAYSGGLGITASNENGSSPGHTVDNNGLDEFLLFQFSENVVISGLGFSAYGDTDFAYSIASTSSNSLFVLPDYDSFASTFIPTVDVAGPTGSNGSYVTQPINGNQKAGNLLVVAASLLSSQSNDAFKVKSLTYSLAPPPTPVETAVPEPATWAMMIGGLAVVGMSMRRRKVIANFA